MNTRQRTITVCGAVAALSCLGACAERTPEPAAKASSVNAEPDNTQALISQGQRLIRLGGCADCHTPLRFDETLGMPVPQQDRALSGHPEGAPDPSAAPGAGDQGVIGPTMTSFRTPFGVVYSSNLTPDHETGLGRWTAEQFIAALRNGKHGGDDTARPILPPMPWANIGSNSDADLRAMFHFLQSIPAISNRVSEPKVMPDALSAIAKANTLMARMNHP
jgi:hypothetical protein